MPPRLRPPRPPPLDDAALMAELAANDEVCDDTEVEGDEEVEARLMRELSAMPDSHAADEQALRASIAAMDDHLDEGDVLMEQLMREERQSSEAAAASSAARAGAAAKAHVARRAMASSATRDLRTACTVAKQEAVRLKRAGDMDGARLALRQAKALQARAESAEAAASVAVAAQPRAVTTQPPLPPRPPPGESAHTALAAALRALGDSVTMDDYYGSDTDAAAADDDDDRDEVELTEEWRSELAALGGDEGNEGGSGEGRGEGDESSSGCEEGTSSGMAAAAAAVATAAAAALRAEELRRAIVAAKQEAVGHRRLGDMDRARAALRLSKDIQATLDALLTPAAAPTLRPDIIEGEGDQRGVHMGVLYGQTVQRGGRGVHTGMQYGQTVGNTSFTRTAAQVEEQGAGDLEESPLPTPVMIPREDVDTTVASAISAMVRVISDDPNISAAGEAKAEGGYTMSKHSREEECSNVLGYSMGKQSRGGEEEEGDDNDSDEDEALLIAELGHAYTADKPRSASRGGLSLVRGRQLSNTQLISDDNGGSDCSLIGGRQLSNTQRISDDNSGGGGGSSGLSLVYGRQLSTTQPIIDSGGHIEGDHSHTEDVEADEEVKVLTQRLANLEAAVLGEKRAALGLRRAGDMEGARAALRRAKAHQTELDEIRSLNPRP